MNLSLRLLILFVFSASNLLGQFGSKTDPSVIKDPSGYKVRAGDMLSISVDGESECSINSKVNDGGIIEVKYLGKLLVAGQTVEEIRNTISTKYKSEKIFSRAVVRVQITSYFQRMVFLSGSVNRKGPYIFPPEVEAMNIVEVIARAGGFNDIAKKNKVSVTRTFFDESGNSINTKTFEVDVESLSSPSSSRVSKNWFWIYPGDRINVPERLL